MAKHTITNATHTDLVAILRKRPCRNMFNKTSDMVVEYEYVSPDMKIRAVLYNDASIQVEADTGSWKKASAFMCGENIVYTFRGDQKAIEAIKTIIANEQ